MANEVSHVIAPNDEMFNGDLEHYLSVGRSAIRNIDIALAVSSAPPIKRILDLPCGHGRVLRALVRRFPDAEITACDISHDAVDFCAGTFGVEGVYSRTEAGGIPIDKEFNLIWSGSLLTHLDEANAVKFLLWFADRLADGGILVVTLHGRFSIVRQLSGAHKYVGDQAFFGALQGYLGRGYGYVDYDGREGFGLSLTSPSWATAWVEGREDIRLLSYGESAWDSHHDVLMLQKARAGWKTIRGR